MESGAIARETLTQMLISYVGLPKVHRFLVALRTIGFQAAERIRMDIPAGQPARQYLIASFVSPQELRSGNLAVLTEYGEYLARLNPNLRLTERFAIHKRTITLLPCPGYLGHCEARLVNPTDDMLKHLLTNGESNTNNDRNQCSDRHFLVKMKESFLQEFGAKEPCLIIVYSYYAPCTQPRHMCSKLLSEFALRNNENIVVAYDHFHNTDLRLAWRNLMSARTHVVSPKQLEDIYAAIVAETAFKHFAMWHTMASWYRLSFQNCVGQKR